MKITPAALCLLACAQAAEISYIGAPDYEKAGGLHGTFRKEDMVIAISGLGQFNYLVIENVGESAKVMEGVGGSPLVLVSSTAANIDYVSANPIPDNETSSAYTSLPSNTTSISYTGSHGYHVAHTSLNLTSLLPCTAYRISLLTSSLSVVQSEVFQLTPCLSFDSFYLAIGIAGFFILISFFSLMAHTFGDASEQQVQSKPLASSQNPLLPEKEVSVDGDKQTQEQEEPQEREESLENEPQVEGDTRTDEVGEGGESGAKVEETLVQGYDEHGAEEAPSQDGEREKDDAKGGEQEEQEDKVEETTPGDADTTPPVDTDADAASQEMLKEGTESSKQQLISTVKSETFVCNKKKEAVLSRQIMSFGLLVLCNVAAIIWIVPLFSVATLDYFILSADYLIIKLLPLSLILAALGTVPMALLFAFVNTPSYEVDDAEESEDREMEGSDIGEDVAEKSQKSAVEMQEGEKQIEKDPQEDTIVEDVVEDYQEQRTAYGYEGHDRQYLASAVAARLRARQRRAEVSKPHEGWRETPGQPHYGVHSPQSAHAQQYYPFPTPHPPVYPPNVPPPSHAQLPGQYPPDAVHDTREQERQLLRDRVSKSRDKHEQEAKDTNECLRKIQAENELLKEQVSQQKLVQEQRFIEQEKRWENMLQKAQQDMRSQHEIEIERWKIDMEKRNLEMEKARAIERESENKDRRVSEKELAFEREKESFRNDVREREWEREKELSKERENMHKEQIEREKEQLAREKQRMLDAEREERESKIKELEKENESLKRQAVPVPVQVLTTSEKGDNETTPETENDKENLLADEDNDRASRAPTQDILAASAASMPDVSPVTITPVKLTMEGNVDDLPLDFSEQFVEELKDKLLLCDPYVTDLKVTQGSVIATFTAHSRDEITFHGITDIVTLPLINVVIGAFNEAVSPIAWEDVSLADPAASESCVVVEDEITEKENEAAETEEKESTEVKAYKYAVFFAIVLLEVGAVAYFKARDDTLLLGICGSIALVSVGAFLANFTIGGAVLQMGVIGMICHTYGTVDSLSMRSMVLASALTVAYVGYVAAKFKQQILSGILVVVGLAGWDYYTLEGEGYIVGGVGMGMCVAGLAAVYMFSRKPNALGLHGLWYVLVAVALHACTLDVLASFYDITRYHVFVPVWASIVCCGRLHHTYEGTVLPVELSQISVTATLIACEAAMLWCSVHIFATTSSYTHVNGVLILLAEVLFFSCTIALPLVYKLVPSSVPKDGVIPVITDVLLAVI